MFPGYPTEESALSREFVLNAVSLETSAPEKNYLTGLYFEICGRESLDQNSASGLESRRLDMLVETATNEDWSRSIRNEPDAQDILEMLNDPGYGQKAATGQEILESPLFGMWADRDDIDDSVEYINRMRQERRERRKASW